MFGLAFNSVCARRLAAVCMMLAVCAAAHAQNEALAQAAGTGPRVLDRVVAVVNNQVILESDLQLEIRFYRLLPVSDRRDSSPERSLQRLITRALIEQQIVQEDPHGLEITPEELKANLADLRQNLPVCKQRDCVSDTGWTATLTTYGLTPERVDEYWSNRMALLRFIEQRFRSGIRILPEDIQKYYDETLLPQYSDRSNAPLLDKVSQRIQEILLQQQVNALLNDWLKSLQDQGQVEVLDPALAEQKPSAVAPEKTPGAGGDL